MIKRRIALAVAALLLLAPSALADTQMYIFDDMEMALYLSDETIANAQVGHLLTTQEPAGQNGLSLIFFALDDLSKLEDVTFITHDELNSYIREIGVPIFGVVKQEAMGIEIPGDLAGMEETELYKDGDKVFRLYHLSGAAVDDMDETLRAVAAEFLTNFDDPATSIVVGDAYPSSGDSLLGDFSAKDIYLKGVHTPDIFKEHKLTMVNVWGTFCGPCINEMPDLAAIADEYAEKGFQIVGIVSDVASTAEEGNSTLDLARTIAEETGADNYLHLIPDDIMVLAQLKNTAYIPETFFVDSEGKPVGESVVGSNTKAQWVSIIEERLAMVEE